MITNPYRIQPNENWEIQAISIEVENLINNKIKLLLYLLERYLSNFYHGAEKYYKSSGSFNIFPFQKDIDNLKFNRFLYPKVDNLLKSKLRKTLEEIQELYSIEDINNIDSKNNYQFLAISPFLFEFRTWENLMSDILKKYYSKDSKHFRKKLGLLIDYNLKYLKIEKIWNLQEEYHFLLTDEEFNRASENNEFIDIIKNFGYDSELEKNIISYKFQKENSHSSIHINLGEIYFKAIEQIKIEKRKLPSKKNFEIKLTKYQLNILYDKLENQLDFFSSKTTKEIWTNILLNNFENTVLEQVIFTPNNIIQVYYLFEFFLKKYSEFDTKGFYDSKKFSFENSKLNYNSAKTSYNKTKKTYNTFKGKQVLDRIIKDIIKK